MIGKTSALNLTDSYQFVVNNPEDSNSTVEVVSVFISNKSSEVVTVDVTITRNSVDYSILNSGAIPANKSLSLFLSKDFGVYLEPGDSLKAKASDLNASDIVCSYYLKDNTILAPPPDIIIEGSSSSSGILM
jgi:hypothetical protein